MHFAKHETFHIRDGWLYKGLNAVGETPEIFLQEDAPEKLGLGKNMVRALRFWMQATGMTLEEFSNRTKAQRLTSFGELVLQHDPYIELDGTVWLIHYHLVSSDDLATTWYWFFNHYAPTDFTREECIERLGQWIGTIENAEEVSENSLIKDFDCLTRTYLPSRRDRSPEDQIESPLSSLGLLSIARDQLDDSGKRINRYRLNVPDIANLPPLVFLYVLLKRQEIERSGSRQVDLVRALREVGNVGRVFNIGARELDQMLIRLDDAYPAWRITLVRTGGLDQLTLPDLQPETVLQRFYEEQQ